MRLSAWLVGVVLFAGLCLMVALFTVAHAPVPAPSPGPVFDLAQLNAEDRCAPEAFRASLLGLAGNSRGSAEHFHGPASLEPGSLEAEGYALAQALHCNACHSIAPELEHGAGHDHGQGAAPPDLLAVADKLRPGWTYEYLRRPRTLRPWLTMRMPDFRLDAREAVALVRYMESELRGSTTAGAAETASAANLVVRPTERERYLEAGRRLMSEEHFACWSCHVNGDERPDRPAEQLAPDLAEAAARLRPGWIDDWLRDPAALAPGTAMPAYFSDESSGPEEILDGDEEQQIIAIREYILSLGQQSLAAGAKSSGWQAASRRHADVEIAEGRRLVEELNCAGCHVTGDGHERKEVGPTLAGTGDRSTVDALQLYLQEPERRSVSPIATHQPGFRLTADDARRLAAYLTTLTDTPVVAENERD